MNADGTGTMGNGGQQTDAGTWNIVDGLFYLKIKPTHRPWWIQIRVNLLGGSESWQRIVHLNEDELTLQPLTRDRNDAPAEPALESRRVGE